MRQATALLFLITSLLPAPQLMAQGNGDREERWYRVELLIFSNEAGISGGGESWPPAPKLAYPKEFRFLVDRDRVAASLEGLEATSELSATGIHTITIVPESDEEELPSVEHVEPESAETSPPPLAEDLPPPKPTPFITLPRDQLEFADAAGGMQRRGGRSILFHETWLQPVHERGVSLPLVVDRSGDSQEWPRLQGSVLLHLSRYLHLESQLWLNTPGAYLPGDWQMPAPPLGPPSLVVIEPEPEEADLEQGATEAYAPLRDENPEGLEAAGEEYVEEELGPVYPWRHAVLLDQKRRMRSNEVHYVDHPMLGLVIKLTPLSEEELEIIALEELAAAEDSALDMRGNQGLQ